jgi:ABC-type nitrate/sulfonate/bicarbonate transport system ATPase subunit
MQEYSYTDQVIMHVDNVSLKYNDPEKGERLILRDINVEIKDIVRPGKTTGQIVGFLGPSGRGKTQLFKILAGLHQPTTGQVLINGKPVVAGDVGVVAQNYPLFEHRTVADNLTIGAKKNKALTAAEKKDKIDFYLTKFKMTEQTKAYPATLSGGQRQRIAIIQQLLCSEHFLLMDEPFSGLDVCMVDQCLEVILEVSNLDELNTVIIVSHDYQSTSAVANNLWFLGYDFDPEGKPIPGARIKWVDDLMKRGLCWQYPQIFEDLEFMKFSKEVRKLMYQL